MNFGVGERGCLGRHFAMVDIILTELSYICIKFSEFYSFGADDNENHVS